MSSGEVPIHSCQIVDGSCHLSLKFLNLKIAREMHHWGHIKLTVKSELRSLSAFAVLIRYRSIAFAQPYFCKKLI